jgi:putative ABC transport system permease protein
MDASSRSELKENTSRVPGALRRGSIGAVRAAFLAVRSWLRDYPYRIGIGMDVFLVSGLAALVIALLTVIYLAVKAAVAVPTRSLRYE